MKKDITTIVEQTRLAFGLTRDEYALCAYIQFRIADPRNTKPGWCTDSKEEIAEFIGITRPGLYKMVDRLEQADLLETFGRCSAIRVTERWIDANAGCKLSLQNQKMLKVSKRKLSLQKSVNKVTRINKVKDDIGRSNTAVSDETAVSFENFWTSYAFKKGSKKRACEKWNKLGGAERLAIMQTLPLYLRDTVTEDSGRKDKFKPLRKYPEFYLSGRLWEAYAERAEETAKAESIPTQFDEQYQQYLEWVKKTYPAVIAETKHMSKSQYIQYKTTYYVQGKSWMGDQMERTYLIRAHESMNLDPAKRATYHDVFALHCEFVQQHVKAHAV